MALEPARMIRVLDEYGFTGAQSETEYPEGTEGWDSYPIPWDEVLVDDRQMTDAGVWRSAGNEIVERALRNPPAARPSDVDALAWYLPFHYFGLDWGIYVKEESIFDLAALIHAEAGRPAMNEELAEDLCRMALSILYLHEAFHHKVESFATRLEIASRRPIYRAYRDHVVNAVRNTDLHLEEAVACAEMFTRLDEVAYRKGINPRIRRATKSFLQNWIPMLNPGYRLGLEHTGDDSKWMLQSQIAEASVTPVGPPIDWELADNMLRGFYDKDVIAHVIVPRGAVTVIPWFSSADPLVSVSTERIVRLVRREFGYVEVPGRGKGGHRWFECPAGGRPPFPLPANRESLSPVVLRCVASALGFRSIRELAQAC